MPPFSPPGLRLRRFLSGVAVVVAIVASSGIFVGTALAATVPLVATMTPTSPTYTDRITVTATASGCGNTWTIPPRLMYSVSSTTNGSINYNGSYTAAELTVSADRDTVTASRTIGPLAAGNYDFFVYGNGTCFGSSFPFSDRVNFTVKGAPTAPSRLLTSAGNAQATVSWTAPTTDNGSAITSYTVTSSPDSRTCRTSGLICTVTGLTNGTSYTFTVTATNFYGSGPPSAPSAPVVPKDRPSPPTGVTATASSGQVAVSWQAAADNGAPVMTYLVTSTPESRTCVTSGTLSCTVTGLTNGTPYTFVVTATNSAGTSDASSASSAVVPLGGPAAPTNVSAAVGVKQATVSWDASADGGSAVTGYTVTSSPEGRTCSTSGGLSCTVGGLSDGTSYTFTVTATSAVGTSSASDPSAPVTTPDAPDAPTHVTASAGIDEALVTWDAAVDNGSAVTQYVVTSSPDAKTCSTTGGLSCTVSGLATGTAYTFSVTATNAVGTSAASIPSTAVTTVGGARRADGRDGERGRHASGRGVDLSG